jgi:hypothetical protein
VTSTRSRVFWLVAYGVAMGFLEVAVVVYLRELYYPRGFLFPVAPMPGRIAAVEVAREAATLLMLFAVAFLAGRGALDRFFVFGFLFGVWDLVYYAGLRAVLGWPESLFTWDLLFLIPVPWLAPVLYPGLVASLLIVGFATHEWLVRRGRELRPTTGGFRIASAGALAIVVSFCWRFRDVLEGREPGAFPDWIFWPGLAVAVLPFALATRNALRR